MSADKGSPETHSSPEGLEAVCNPAWFKDKASSSIWLRGYRMMRLIPDQLPKGFEALDLGPIRAVFIRGSVKFLDTSSETLSQEGADTVYLSVAPKRSETPKGTYLVLMAPHDVDGQPGSEQRTRNAVSSAAGFLKILLGPNVVYEHLFDNIVKADGTGLSALGKAMVTPTTQPAIELSATQLEKIAAAGRALESRPSAEAHRIKLALRWFQKSTGIGGIDEFLSGWIALETLSMPDTTNIRPANEALGKAYRITREEAAQRFMLGRLLDLRSRIVHSGKTPAINAQLLDYLAAVFRDIFNELLGLPCEGAADAVLTAHREKICEAIERTKAAQESQDSTAQDRPAPGA